MDHNYFDQTIPKLHYQKKKKNIRRKTLHNIFLYRKYDKYEKQLNIWLLDGYERAIKKLYVFKFIIFAI